MNNLKKYSLNLSRLFFQQGVRRNSGFLFFCFLVLPLLVSAQQPTLTLEQINDFKKNHNSVTDIEPQRIKISDSYFLRFPELGKIYNPMFPQTRKKIRCDNYQLNDSKLEGIGFSMSTNRASVKLKGRVGTFYGTWRGENCSSLIEYKVTRNGDYLEVSGKIYKCFSIA